MSAVTQQPTRIFLVRHGEVFNPDKVLYGRQEGFRLSERGEHQAQLAAEFLANPKRDVAAVVASPLQRAQETAAPIAEAYGLPVLTDERLTEAGSHFEGTTIGAKPTQLLNPKHWKYLYNPTKPSWGEPFAEQAERFRAVIDELRHKYAGHDVIVVSHQSPIWAVRRDLEGKRLWGDPRKRQCSVASVTTLTYGPDDDEPTISYDEPAAELSKTLSAEGWSAK
ncbi:MAG: histidine phosphatase family protein [Promicromonosporaceae bacterium]|nr:histidine phosphatase family protein [Promicromonosporaceae bacterium]